MAWLACDTHQPPPPARLVRICATEFPLADIAREIGGDRVEVDWLLQLGDPLTTYTMNTADRARLRLTDLILCDGVQRTEPWAAADVNRLRDTGSVISDDILPLSHTAPANGVLYLDPLIGKQLAVALVDALITRAPRSADTFRQRAKDYGVKIDAIVAGYPNSTFGKGKLIVLSNEFAPLLDRFGVTSVPVDADPLHLTPDTAAAIRSKAAEAGAKAMLVPFDTPPGTRQDLAAQTGLVVFAIDPLGYRNFDQHGTYLDLIRFNLHQLKQATWQGVEGRSL